MYLNIRRLCLTDSVSNISKNRILNPFGIRNIIGTGSFSRGKFEYGRVYLYAIKHYSS